MNTNQLVFKGLLDLLAWREKIFAQDQPKQHPAYVYLGKSKTFKKNKRRGL